MIDIVVIVFLSLSGAILHYVKRYLRGQHKCSLASYVADNVWNSLGSVIGAVMAGLGFYLASGVIDSACIAGTLLAGFTSDSTINK